MKPLPYLLALALTLTACGETSAPTDPDDGTAPETETQFFEVIAERGDFDGEMEIDEDKVDALADVNAAAAFRFYRLLRAADEPNLIFSPFSISRAFAGYYNGVREADAFEAVFGFTPEVATIPTFLQLTHLATNRDASNVDPDERTEFMSDDVYWVDERTGGGGGDFSAYDRVHSLPLAAQPAKSTELINGWIEDKSRGLLPDFLPSGAIGADTEAVTTNVVFFLGAWGLEFSEAEIEFEGSGTQPAFRGADNMLASVGEDVTVVAIPYGQDYRHWVLMPHGDLDEFAQSLDETVYADLRSRTSSQYVSLTMPEFEVRSSPDIAGAINGIRAETGTEGGTLTGAFREAFLHKAAIEVSKEGTKAAAATVIIEYSNNAYEPEPVPVSIDRPFVHIIEDARTGSILFLGEITEL